MPEIVEVEARRHTGIRERRDPLDRPAKVAGSQRHVRVTGEDQLLLPLTDELARLAGQGLAGD
ncbi:hypothetical protein [Actinoplanes derwentensis]|uniref:hypothetical protein n=1 Tax=Actinoplanes derwentensis TaxID=113562 RepID=UPI0012FDBFCB|nr:hypothetical protein [Actinoplanes derwentensis]